MIVAERERAAVVERERRPTAVARGRTKLAKLTRQKLQERVDVDKELVAKQAVIVHLGRVE